MNCSTSFIRHISSSGVDVYTAVAMAAGALYGPKHGGANEAVIRMLEGKLFSDGSIDKKVTYEFVKADMQYFSQEIDSHRCLKCGVEAQGLSWYHFRSSDASWRHLAGCEGFYSKCPKCNATVNSIVTVMN